MVLGAKIRKNLNLRKPIGEKMLFSPETLQPFVETRPPYSSKVMWKALDTEPPPVSSISGFRRCPQSCLFQYCLHHSPWFLLIRQEQLMPPTHRYATTLIFRHIISTPDPHSKYLCQICQQTCAIFGSVAPFVRQSHKLQVWQIHLCLRYFVCHILTTS